LKDRLRAIGRLSPEWDAGKLPGSPPPPPASAAEFYLGEPAGDIARKMSADWRQSMAAQWKTRYDHAQKIAADLVAMEKPAEAPPTAAQIWEKARRLVELDGDGAAITMLEQVVAMEPKHPGANFILGRHCLQTGDPRGVDLIETAIASDPSLTGTGCNLLYAHFNRTGQREK
jgi:hypothetical protein